MLWRNGTIIHTWHPQAMVPGNRSRHTTSALWLTPIPVLPWSARPDGSAEFFNQRWLEYAGLSTERTLNWGWIVAVHPDDRSRLADYWQSIQATGEPGEIEARPRRFDGECRWFLVRCTSKSKIGILSSPVTHLKRKSRKRFNDGQD